MSVIHSEIRDRLLSYVDGRLDEELRRQVQAHLEGCESCSQELAAITAMTGVLKQIGQDDGATAADAGRYGCPTAEQLGLHASLEVTPPRAEGEWIVRHLDACPRCQREVDLIRLMTRQLAEPSETVAPHDLSTQGEDRLIALVRHRKGADRRAAVPNRFPSLRPSFLWRAALGIGCAAAVAAWGIIQLQSDHVFVAQRSTEGDVRGFQPAPPSPTPREQPPPSVPAIAAKVEAPTAPARQPSLPPLVPATQGEMLKVLILPTPVPRGLRSAVAAGLGGRLGIVQPPDREFSSEPTVDDLTANRRLGRLFGVRYVLEIGVKEQASGYLVLLRAADTETGGVVATREELTSEEKALTTVAGRLARELQQTLLARP